MKPAFCMIPLPVSGLKLIFSILFQYFKAPSGKNMLLISPSDLFIACNNILQQKYACNNFIQNYRKDFQKSTYKRQFVF